MNAQTAVVEGQLGADGAPEFVGGAGVGQQQRGAVGGKRTVEGETQATDGVPGTRRPAIVGRVADEQAPRGIDRSCMCGLEDRERRCDACSLGVATGGFDGGFGPIAAGDGRRDGLAHSG